MAISTATAAAGGGGGGGSMGRGMDLEHLVLPGQVIAVSSKSGNDENNNDDGFLRGHGTYVERNARTQEERLIASVCGTVERVNKLITVRPYCASLYTGQVGDFVIGRITSVGTTRWMVKVSSAATTTSSSSSSSLMKEAALPLSGVHLPGGAQRLRTAEDSLNMRSYLKEGDLVCSEVHKVQPNDGGSLSLHIRSHKFTKLENGIIVPVPAALIARRKNHVVSLIHNTIDGLWGVNGNIWLQRSMTNPHDDRTTTTTTTPETTIRPKPRRTSDDGATIADVSEKLRQEHAATPVDVETRRTLARLRNAIICLRSVHTMCTPEHVEIVYHKSLNCGGRCIPIPHMLYPETILVLTDEFR